MKKGAPVAKTIDAYIKGFPADVQKRLNAMRTTIRKAAPTATEKISYRMPTFYLNGNLVHFAGYDHHVGFYPGANGIAQFRDKVAGYKSAKGSVQFQHDEPLPLALVAEITAFRVGENEAKPKRAPKPKAKK